MRNHLLFLPVFVLAATASMAQERLTLEGALQRARQRAPRILAAEDRIAEARGRLRGASVLFQENPELEFEAGRRSGVTDTSTDIEVSAVQRFEIGGRRGSRIAAAKAGVDEAAAQRQNVVRMLLGDVARAYLEAAAGSQRVRNATTARDISNALLRSMERRLELGDVPILQVNLARSAAARARADLQAAEAGLRGSLGTLRILLGMASTEPLEVAGDLPWKVEFQADTLVAEALNRPDIQAIAAELRQAEAERGLGRGMSWPELGAGVRWEREEGDKIIRGILSLSVPLFNRGQELQAVGAARATRLQRELEASRRAAVVEVNAALESYQLQRAAAENLERDAIAKVEENEQLARRSFEEGEISILELLLIRRDNLEVRNLYVDRQLEAGVAAIEVQERAGTLR